jgi:dTDP-glucose 4,6-dehydratase
MKKNIILTGCCGFIGSNFIKTITLKKENKEQYNFIILDLITYAGNYKNIENDLKENDHLKFYQIDLRNSKDVDGIFEKYNPSGILHFAAESHVDRSIENPNIFVETNVLGTMNLLNSALKIHRKNQDFRFLQVSTDEVYGQLSETDPAFTENTPIAPSSPYSASKASSDLLVSAYHHTFGLNTIITRCSNNYGPYQFPEKFIPVIIQKSLNNKKLPIYGEGKNIRDWIYVDDHNEGIWKAYQKGKPGEVYNFGGQAERRNIDLAKNVLKHLGKSEELLEYVTDRLGHDFRYAINFEKAQRELGWSPKIDFENGLKLTIDWYVQNQAWVQDLLDRKQNE